VDHFRRRLLRAAPAGIAGQSVVGIMAVVVAPAVGRVPARLGAAGVVVGAVAVMIIAGLVIPVVHQRPGDERHGTATPLGLVTLIAAGGPAPVLAAVSTDAVGLRQTYPASAQVRTPPTPPLWRGPRRA